jgi:hypothetical protein
MGNSWVDHGLPSLRSTTKLIFWFLSDEPEGALRPIVHFAPLSLAVAAPSEWGYEELLDWWLFPPGPAQLVRRTADSRSSGAKVIPVVITLSPRIKE